MNNISSMLNRHFEALIANDPTLLTQMIDNDKSKVETLLSSSKSTEEKLADIHRYLDESVFSRDKAVLESAKREQLFVLGKLFAFVNEHISSFAATNPALARKLKVQFANLPAPDDRACFPHLNLTPREKLEILISRLQEKEAKAFAELISFLKDKNPEPQEVRYITKLASTKSPLRKEMQETLQSALHDFSSGYRVLSHAEALYRLSKTCRYFESQLTASDEQIFIPQWYHSTDWEKVAKILDNKVLKVGHRKFVGAWVSSQREIEYGQYTFCFNGKLCELDKMPIFRDKRPERWIGLQKDIPLQNRQYLGIVARPCKKKDKKVELLAALQSRGFGHVRVFSEGQVDAIQHHVTSILGHPDLSELWWSEKPLLPIYQQHLQEMARTIASDATLKELLHNESQSSISQLLQKVAIPFYKLCMPKHPTYLPEGASRRDTLPTVSDEEYSDRKKQVLNKKIPAREIHGTVHSPRTTLWGLVLRLVCLKFKLEERVDPVLLALATALHDAARENEEKDYWDRESAKLLEIILKGFGVSEDQIKIYVQAIAEKDPKDDIFTTLAQLIVQGADCIEIMRLTGLAGFDTKKFHLYQSHPEMREYLTRILREAAIFIARTEEEEVKLSVDHKSKNIFGNLVRFLFRIHEEESEQFPTLTELLKPVVQDLLPTKDKTT